MTERELWGAMLYDCEGKPMTLATHLWDVRRAADRIEGSAMPYALFVSRRAVRNWCREVNADMLAKGWDDGCRLRPVRVRERLELV